MNIFVVLVTYDRECGSMIGAFDNEAAAEKAKKDAEEYAHDIVIEKLELGKAYEPGTIRT
ncbi:MAG: hypothetical protein JKX76_00105 [Colwellia sp.]|nr:hypothetical protein [Colwellia sp.]